MMILVLELFTSCLNSLIEAKFTVLRDLSLIFYMSKTTQSFHVILIAETIIIFRLCMTTYRMVYNCASDYKVWNNEKQ